MTNIIKSTANAKKHLLNDKLDKKSLLDDLDVLVFVVLVLELEELLELEAVETPALDELLELEPVEETLELELMVLESVDFAGLDTGSTSEVIGTTMLELSGSSDLILLSTLEKSKPQLEQ